MPQEYTAVANSWVLWLACIPAVLWVLLQSGLFLVRSLRDGKEMGLTTKQLRRGIRSASIISIGPCLVMLTSMLSLIVIVGAPLAWMRVDVIGGVGYEIMGATFAADALDIQVASDQMTVDFLGTAAIVMAVGCIGWIVVSALFSDRMEGINRALAGGSKAMIPLVSAGCVLGCYSNMVVERVYPLGPETAAALGAALTVAVLHTLVKRFSLNRLRDWILSIAMVVGLVCGALVI